MKQFNVDRIWGTMTDPVQIFADVGTEVYSYDGPMPEEYVVAGAWADSGRVWRDYWRFFCDRSEDNGAHFTNVLELQGDTIKEFRK